MEIKTDVRVSLDLHFTSDDLANRSELARLAAVCDGLQLLLRSQTVSQETLSEDGDPGRALPALTATDSTHPVEQAEETAETDAVALPSTGRQMPASRKWTFEQFDAAVRAEMQRLAGPGKMPTTTVWDQARSPDLPTWTGVIRRYKAKNLPGLAAKLGLQPAGVRPGPAPKAASSNNGVAGRHL